MTIIIFIFICLSLATVVTSFSIAGRGGVSPMVGRANNGNGGKRQRRNVKETPEEIEQRNNKRIEEERKERELCDAMRTSLEGISCATPGLLSKETHGMCVAYEKRCTINTSLYVGQIIFLLVGIACSMVALRPPTLFGVAIPFGTEI